MSATGGTSGSVSATLQSHHHSPVSDEKTQQQQQQDLVASAALGASSLGGGTGGGSNSGGDAGSSTGSEGSRKAATAFTIDLDKDDDGEGSAKKLDITGPLSKWAPKHRRNLSLTKVEEHKVRFPLFLS